MGKESLWLLVIGFSLIASEPLFNSTEEVFNATSKFFTFKIT